MNRNSRDPINAAATSGVAFMSPRILTSHDLHAFEDAMSADLFDFSGGVRSYSGGQDVAGAKGAVVEHDGSALRLVGNTWKKAALPDSFTIAQGDVLHVTLKIEAGRLGEIHAIGFDSDDSISNAGTVIFQLAGTQTLDVANQAYRGKIAAGGTVDYQIDLSRWAGQKFSDLTFINDDDRYNSAQAVWSDIRVVSSDVVAVRPSGLFDFTGKVKGYAGGQDVAGIKGAQVEDSGTALRLTGNTWKKAALPEGFTIAKGDILNVTLKIEAGGLGEIHGIGFDSDDSFSNAGTVIFQLAGTQTLDVANQAYRGKIAEGGTKTYKIDLSAWAGQKFSDLTFINDDDRHADARVVWSDVSIVSSAPAVNRAPVTSAIDLGSITESALPKSFDLLAKASDADGDAMSISNLSVTDSAGAALAFTLNGSRLTIDPRQMAKTLMAGDTETVSISYGVEDGRGGRAVGSATLDILGEGLSFTSGPKGGYNIEVVFAGTWTQGLRAAFIDSAEMISSIITGDLPSAVAGGRTVDDLRIVATLEEIDGYGGVLGSAGPRQLRLPSYLPVEGVMKFDSVDAANLLHRGIWDDVIFHEMMHVVGMGTVWNSLGLVKNVSGDLRFVGVEAREAYAKEFPTIFAKDARAHIGVPIETDGGAGTAGAHWDDATFGSEIMTGYINGTNVLSDMTIAALEDMGYETVWDSFLA